MFTSPVRSVRCTGPDAVEVLNDSTALIRRTGFADVGDNPDGFLFHFEFGVRQATDDEGHQARVEDCLACVPLATLLSVKQPAF
jgi:hypothetical protein